MERELFQIDFENLKQALQQIEKPAHFGVEREGLRVRADGTLSLTPHPAVFGNKLTAKNITTDFSESQIEVITPVCDSIEGAYAALNQLCNRVQKGLPADEYLWPQSMPCPLPDDGQIPVAYYAGDSPEAKAANAYRQGLLAKYGGKKQMLSGIHFNFSFSDEMIEGLYQQSRSSRSLQDFKNQLYLKIARGYLRHRWLVIYLTGCTPGCHETYTDACVNAMIHRDDAGYCYQYGGPSIRNSAFGYKNLIPLFPDYTSVENFTRDVQRFVNSGQIIAPKELYTQVRLKPKDPANLIASLQRDGIQYLELRTLDLNVYDPCGIAGVDMQFLYRFILWLLITPEDDVDDWQAEALYNEEAVALHGFEPDLPLKRAGGWIPFKDWAEEILSEMLAMDGAFGTTQQPMLITMQARIRHPEQTYAGKLLTEIETNGTLPMMLDLAATYKTNATER